MKGSAENLSGKMEGLIAALLSHSTIEAAAQSIGQPVFANRSAHDLVATREHARALLHLGRNASHGRQSGG